MLLLKSMRGMGFDTEVIPAENGRSNPKMRKTNISTHSIILFSKFLSLSKIHNRGDRAITELFEP